MLKEFKRVLSDFAVLVGAAYEGYIDGRGTALLEGSGPRETFPLFQEIHRQVRVAVLKPHFEDAKLFLVESFYEGRLAYHLDAKTFRDLRST